MKLSVRAGRRTRWRESWNRPKPIWTPRPERLRTWWAVLRTTRATSPNWSNKWKSRRWDSYLTSHCVVIDDTVFWSSVKNKKPIAYTHLKMFFRNRMYEKFIHMFYISYMDGFLFWQILNERTIKDADILHTRFAKLQSDFESQLITTDQLTAENQARVTELKVLPKTIVTAWFIFFWNSKKMYRWTSYGKSWYLEYHWC